MSHHFFMGAINKLNNTYEYPKIANKKNKYKCPECEKDVIFRNGKIKQPHFAHYKSDNPCTYYDRPNEHQIHKEAKMIMKTLLNNKEPIYIYRKCIYCKKEDEVLFIFEDEYNDEMKAIIEYKFNYNDSLKSADVALIQNNKLIYIFEICYTNKTREENRPEPWFEINAVELINLVNNRDINIKDEFDIECIRNNYKCRKCIEKNKCDGRGICLIQSHTDLNKYIKNKDILCSFNCLPKKCSTNYCKSINPQWVLDTSIPLDKCINCKMGIERDRLIYLNVPYDRKDEAKMLGAKWWSNGKKWVIKSNHYNKKKLLELFDEASPGYW